MEESLYKVQELNTTGWETIPDDENSKLTKEQCNERIRFYLESGIAPNRLRAVRDN